MRTNFLILFYICILALFLPLSSHADSWIRVKPSPPVDTRILVEAVDIPNQQITIVYDKDKTKHVYRIDLATTVKTEGNTGTINDIKAGQQVYSYVERDDQTLDSIEVATAQKPPTTKKVTSP